MKRSDLEHILRASKGVTGETEFIVKLANENTGGAIGWCLEPHDLAYSKLAARREKDLAFVSALLRHNLVRLARLRRLIQLEVDAGLQERLTEGFAICRAR
jgi:hypothetical protein